MMMTSLTHWGLVTHICVGKLIIIGSDNVLSPGRHQAIIWTSTGILLIRPLGSGVHFVSASMCLMTHINDSRPRWVNTLRLEQKGRHFGRLHMSKNKKNRVRKFYLSQNGWQPITRSNTVRVHRRLHAALAGNELNVNGGMLSVVINRLVVAYRVILYDINVSG